jgi:hypothetical protein
VTLMPEIGFGNRPHNSSYAPLRMEGIHETSPHSYGLLRRTRLVRWNCSSRFSHPGHSVLHASNAHSPLPAGGTKLRSRRNRQGSPLSRSRFAPLGHLPGRRSVRSAA